MLWRWKMEGKEKRIAVLNASLEQRKQDCLERTEKAIAKLIQNNESLCFAAIARTAGVSVSYLYKYSDVKERIQMLQKKQREGINKISKPQTASEKSKQVIINQFRERIKTLEYEKKQLSLQNEKITGQLYEMGKNQDLLERLKEETLRISKENKQLKVELSVTLQNLNECQKSLIKNNPKIAYFDYKYDYNLTNDEISDDLKFKLSEMGISLNKTLIKLIKSVNISQVINALSVVKEAEASGKVRSKSGLFRKALEEAWQPNKSNKEREFNTIKSNFDQWYDLACAYGIVIGCREENGIMMVQENTGNWYKFEEFSDKWTLEYLKRKQKI